jgi:hypothetical protein
MAKQRPTRITVFAILNIVFGALWLFCITCGIVAAPAMQQLQAQQQGQQPGLNQQDFEKRVEAQLPAYNVIKWAGLGLSLVLGVILIVAGIGLLNMASWGRGLSIVWAVIAILYLLISLVYNIIYVNPVMAETMKEQQVQLPAAFFIGMEAASTLLMILYPIVLLIVMLLPATGTALAGSGPRDLPGDAADDYYDPEFERRRRELPPQE